MSANPWMKFYPRDWRGDQALRAVSIAARGLWMEMLCIMHEATPYGHLVLGAHAVSNDALARMSGLGANEVSALLIELESAGVFSRTRKHVIYSRRMVSDRNRAEKGRKAVGKRWAQGAENPREKPQPNRSPNREPITQKPEARVIPLSNDNGPDDDPGKAFWDGAKGYLGKSKASLIGKWAQDYGRAPVAEAITAAMLLSPQPPDRVAYVGGILRKRRVEAEEMPIC